MSFWKRTDTDRHGERVLLRFKYGRDWGVSHFRALHEPVGLQGHGDSAFSFS